MNKKIFSCLVVCLPALTGWGQVSTQYNLKADASKLHGGFYVEKIALLSNQLPTVTLIEVRSSPSKIKVSDSLLHTATKIEIALGIERKKTYAYISIPAFSKNNDGIIEQRQNYIINVTEPAQKSTSTSPNFNTLRTTTTASVLANGVWQKLAIANRGVYKIDYDYAKNILGQSGNIASSSIRLFGNGGTMLNESNSLAGPDDLLENAIDMYDGGDGLFGAGDYFLFYANGPTEWLKDSVAQRFQHRHNLYADSSYYFISFNNGTGLRMNNAPLSGTPNTVVKSFNEYAVHQKDLVNIGLFGKTWWGETFGFNSGFSNKQTFTFALPNINDSVYYRYYLASASLGGNAKFSVSLNSNLIGNHDGIAGVGGADGDDPGVGVYNSGLSLIPSTGSLNFDITYEKYGSSAKGYLDYIEINTRRQLNFASGNHLSFRDWRSVGASSIAQFIVANATANMKVWDVSNPLQPLRISGSLSGTDFSFTQDAKTLREYIATENNFLIPQFFGAVGNQNLHGLAQVDYVIIAHPELMEAANKLADFHRNNSGLTVAAVPVNQVYNEFGSGAKDISAIRDFVKMFYNRAGTDEAKMPKYLLLLGQASYDYKNITRSNAKIVPTFETPESLSESSGYCSDDFFALLDSNENIGEGLPLMDIGVGRIPATSAAQANAIVDKIIRYKSKESLGPWRISNMFLGDDEDSAGDHLADADFMYKTIESRANIYRAQKVFLDNMNTTSTPGGLRSPDANKLINDNVAKGTFLINYSGHGSIYTLSKKRIVTQDDYNAWVNPYKLPILITGTCSFGRFDNPSLQSAGEKIILKNDGGAIALITTTQVVYAGPNREISAAYIDAQFSKKANGWNTLGDAYRIGKNKVVTKGDTWNSRKFALLGDPALTPDFPRYDVETDSVQELVDGVALATDSIKSLGNYRIYGSVRNDDGNVMNDFNGKVNITFFDKPQNISIKTANSNNREYTLQNNVIFKGIVSVKNGNFNYEFITPKDINYEFGKGKISYYADNGFIDAAGADTTFTVGGFSDHVIADEDAPIVRPFMNDSLFKDGGLTGSNSILYAIITDKSGINVSGNFVGHDLSAVLDGVVEAPFVLNDYYETAPNTYQRGFVNFPMTGLTDGIHSLKVKAWDVFNNSGEGTIHFEVLNGKVMKLRNIYTYPNPFTDITHFVFEHNHPNEALKATIHIFNTTGGLVRTLEQTFTPSGSNSAEVTWDGTGNGGEKLFPGVYPFRIRIATEKNIEDLGYQKVILVR